MAKSYTLKGPGTLHSKVIVSDQDAHWLNAYKYTVMNTRKQMVVVRSGAGRGIHKLLKADIYGENIQLLHINGNPLDFRRTNCTIVTKADKARLMLLDEKIGCSFSPRRNFKVEVPNV